MIRAAPTNAWLLDEPGPKKIIKSGELKRSGLHFIQAPSSLLFLSLPAVVATSLPLLSLRRRRLFLSLRYGSVFLPFPHPTGDRSTPAGELLLTPHRSTCSWPLQGLGTRRPGESVRRPHERTEAVTES